MNNINIEENIYKVLNTYKDLTIEIKNKLNEDDYEDLSELMLQRENIIDSIKSCDINNIQEIYINMKINELDLYVKSQIESKLENIKKEIIDYKKTKRVNSMYYKNTSEKINIFNKKV